MRCGLELEDIANPGDRSGWIWVKWPLLQPFGGVAENDMVNLGWRETRDFDRRIDHDQFFELDLQRVEVPLALFRETIDRESEHALFVLAQVLNANARDPIEPQLSGRLIARLAVDEFIVAADKDRIAESRMAMLIEEATSRT